MAQDDFQDLGHCKHDKNPQLKADPIVQPNKIDQGQAQPEKVAADAAYTISTIQKSLAEAIVLTFVAGLPVLQPPPKTQVRGVPEVSAAQVVGGSAQVGAATAPIQAQTHTPTHVHHVRVQAASSASESESHKVLNFVKNLLALIIHGTEQTLQSTQQDPTSQTLQSSPNPSPSSSSSPSDTSDTAENQSLSLMLSAMALEMIYISVYGGMTGEEFTSLFTEEVQLPPEYKPVADQLIAFINRHIPAEGKARQEAMAKLIEIIDSHSSLDSLFQSARFLSQVVTQRSLLKEVPTAEQSPTVLTESMGQVEQTKNTLIHSMWQAYSRNLAEFGERMQGKDIQAWVQNVSSEGAKTSTEYYAFVLAQSAIRQVDNQSTLTHKFTQAFDQWVIDPHKKSLASNAEDGFPSSSFIAGCMVCGIDVVRDAVDSTKGIFNQQLRDSPIADVLFAIGPQLTLAVDYQAAAALIAALLNNGAAYKATDDALKKGKNKAEAPKDLDFAINYARNIIAIVTHKAVSSRAHPKEIQERDRLVRLMLSVMALNMLYRSAYGGMTGLEFGAILKGDRKDIHENIKELIEQLVELIKANLPENKQVRADTIIKLMEYVDSKDSINSMLKSTRVLANLLSTQDVDQKRWEVQSG